MGNFGNIFHTKCTYFTESRTERSTHGAGKIVPCYQCFINRCLAHPAPRVPRPLRISTKYAVTPFLLKREVVMPFYTMSKMDDEKHCHGAYAFAHSRFERGSPVPLHM